MAIGCAALLLPSLATDAAASELDPTFGMGGKTVAPVATTLPPEPGPRVKIASSPDGAIVVATEGHVLRYLPDGRLDPDFGRSGEVVLDDFDELSFFFGDVAVDSRGRILVFGTSTDPERAYDPHLVVGGAAAASWVTVVRLDAKGNLDPEFGNGQGFVRNELGVPHLPSTPFPTVRASQGGVDSQDRPVIVGSAPAVLAPCYGHSALTWLPAAIARLTAAGDLDPSFGAGDGSSPVHSLGPSPRLVLDRGDGAVIAGRPESACSNKVLLMRFGADGLPQANFGTDGVGSYFRGLGPLAFDAGGGMLVLQRTRPSALLRIAPGGDIDRAFGRAGRIAISVPGKGGPFNSIAIDSQERILLAGTHVRLQRGRPHRSFAVTRLLPQGKPDLSFGHNSLAITDFGPKIEAVVEGAALDRQGRLVVVGSARNRQREGTGILLARYLSLP